MLVSRVRNEEDLRRALDKLGEPPGGRIRVFRGQTRRYSGPVHDSILASLHRSSTIAITKEWVTLAQEAAFGCLPGGSQIEFEFERVWIPALLQHYGPGSYYVDVTGSLDIALWFALYRFQTQASLERLYFKQQISNVIFNWAWYEKAALPRSSGPGPVVYVFDALTWPGFGEPAHGDLVAVRNLPQGRRLLHRATRLERQDAFLLYAAPDSVFGPDLGHLPRAAFTLAKDFLVPERLRAMTTQDVFPPPGQDNCYSVLLASGLTVKEQDDVYSHALALNCYISGFPPTRSQFEDFMVRFRTEEGLGTR